MHATFDELNESQMNEPQYGDAHYITGYYPQDSMFPPNYHSPPPPTQSGIDSDGLYRAIMVSPSVIANTAAITNTTNVTSGSSPSPYPLSANNLYNQYLTQSSYDVRNSNGFIENESNRISPDSFSNYHHRSMQPTPINGALVHGTYDHQNQGPLMYGNPGFISTSTANIASTEQLVLYDQEEDGFHSKAPTGHVFMNDNAIYSVKASPLVYSNTNPGYYPQTSQQQQQTNQSIYEIAMKGPHWSASRAVTPNPAHHSATTLPPNVRYSPDEGYGEDSSTGVSNLEGTEV